MAQSQLKIKNCPTCSPTGGQTPGTGYVQNPRTQQVGQCPTCGGNGVIPTIAGFPLPYWYVFGPFTANGSVNVIGQSGGQFLKQIDNVNPFEWVMLMGRILQGDSRFVQLQLVDLGAQGTPFSSDPVDFDNFCGTAAEPLPILDPYTFGPMSQLAIKAFPITIAGQTLVIGVGDGATTTFSGVLQTPVLPGSVSVTAGAVVGIDGVTANNPAPANNGAITNAAGTITGTVNYQTGAIAVKFAVAPVANVLVTVTFSLGVGSTVLQVTLFGFSMVGKSGMGSGSGLPGGGAITGGGPNAALANAGR